MWVLCYREGVCGYYAIGGSMWVLCYREGVCGYYAIRREYVGIML